jgi:hypothetical protein
MSDKVLTIWVIYQNPKDHPGKWVLRPQYATPQGIVADPGCAVGNTLEDVRACLPPGLVKLTRHVDDDPVIYETWL